MVVVLVSGLIGAFSGGRLLGQTVNRRGYSFLAFTVKHPFVWFNHLLKNSISVSRFIDAFRD